LEETTVKILSSVSFGIMAFALLTGALVILRAMWRGRQAEREMVEETDEAAEVLDRA
jgi:hypothetical protein